ncbi:DNA polymerase III subunit alpha [Alkalilimnicola sp. S0819]|uniref:DNA polymerase III subunit alpha n=1 Tax=Alkalilimnicola sp. S0819 TaxID=2613922 RepID=UPI001262AC36|nr:DNA polymerase III subunit alpha [Alkalilimnicola sp. S0819]KAB7627930.1 DNA polymerase III subunit alpha [Alkalilimnicola sp. S0819]MPQ15567.1 DNA polymerase III subunit alpha [Alkalilimnicola sp. S0819]
MSEPRFVHLRLHTEYSLSDGMVRIKPLLKAAAQAGMAAIAMTDQGNLYGLVKFYKAALGAGVKPIVGADIWVEDPEAPEGRSRLTLLCRDLLGYRCLTRLLSKGYIHGQQQDVPLIRREWLEEDRAGLIALSGAREGDVGRSLLNGDQAAAARKLGYWQDLYPGAFYLEVQRTGRPGDEEHLHAAVALAAEAGAPVVATNDVRFLKAEDFDAHEVRVCIHDSRTLDDPRRERRYSEQQYLRSEAEMLELFADLPEALANSVEIARRCNLELTLGQPVLPDFPIPAGMSIEEFLREESLRGLEERLAVLLDKSAANYAERRQRYLDRLDMELGIINQMGFPGYFLIVADFIQWAKDHDIPVGPGRGSGAGSLVAYALKITDLDPLAYDLLFERFLNPERVSMPDFDVDFCMENRDRVIDYVAEKYGREKVSQICTHGTMAAKAVVRDVGRVMGHPYGYVDRLSKLIPFEVGMTLTKALEQEPELQELYDTDEDVRELLDMALKLEGLARNVGKHAGGVVIAPSELTDFSPLYCEAGGGGLATQYDKDDVEEVGLVKFDFLGLRTLTIIDWTVKAVDKLRTERGEPRLDISQIPLDDADTFSLLKKCQTTAVFQLESRGMKDLIKRLQPDSFEDIIALVALFRPGPLQSGMVDDFIDRKHGRAKVAYPTPELHHADLEPVLKPTYGVILYQEQVQRIAQVLGGYSLGGADLLRRAMGKKKPEEMAKQRQIFLEGATANGMSEAHAAGIFDLMEKFAGYGFNKSHSAAYALLSYQTAWLKRHYPAPFMAAVLSSDMDNTDKVVGFIEECREMGLRVRPPNVNSSNYAFRAADETTVIYGLGAVKGVGRGAIESIIEEREAHGPYADLFDLCRRADLKKLNRRVLEALIRSGCLDGLADNRASAMAELPQALKAADQHSKNAAAGQDDLFGIEAPSQQARAEDEHQHLPEWDEGERLALEKETLGLYLTGHPITQFEQELEKITSGRIAALLANAQPSPEGRRGRRGGGKRIIAAGLVVAIRTRNTNSGGRMAFLSLDDRTARIEVAVFPEAYERYRNLIIKDELLIVEGGMDFDDFLGAFKISAERLMTLSEARASLAKRLVLKVDGTRAGNGFVGALREALAPYRSGGCQVLLEYRGAGARAMLRFGEEWRVTPSEDLINSLAELVPETPRVEY